MKVQITVLNLKKKAREKKRGRPSDEYLTEKIWEAYRQTRNVREAARRLGMTESRVAYHVKKKRNHMEKK